MLVTLDWVVIIVFFVLIISVGLSYAKRAGKNMDSFFLGGRNLPWYVAGISMVATTFAADTPLAVTELVGKNGISGNWLWWNFLAGGMLTTFFFANLWRRAEVLTEVELIELRYAGKPAAFLRGFKALYLGVFMNVLIIAWVNVALMALLQVFFEMPQMEALGYTALAMVFVAVYSSVSGLIGIAITDMIQFVIAMVGCVILAVLVVQSEQIGGISGLKTQLPDWSLSFFPEISNEKGGAGKSLVIGVGAFLAYTSVQWWASWYPGAEPGGGGYVAQRMMSAKDEKHAIYATLFFQIAHYCIRPWPWIIVGLCAIVLYPDLGEADKKLGFVMAMKDFLPAGLKGLLLIAFFAAYMSTISTQLNWGASYVVNDFYHRFLDNTATDKTLVRVARITTVLLMFLGLAVSTQITSISGVWAFIIECGAGLGLVLILRWYWWRINAWSEITATIAPFLAFAVTKFGMGMAFPESFFYTVGFTTVAWLVVTFFTEPTKDEKLTSFYLKVQPDGWWEPIKQRTNLAAKESNLGGLFLCWISALIMTYSVLFCIGKLIFMEWNSALMWGAAVVLGFIGLQIGLGKSKVLRD